MCIKKNGETHKHEEIAIPRQKAKPNKLRAEKTKRDKEWGNRVRKDWIRERRVTVILIKRINAGGIRIVKHRYNGWRGKICKPGNIMSCSPFQTSFEGGLAIARGFEVHCSDNHATVLQHAEARRLCDPLQQGLWASTD